MTPEDSIAAVRALLERLTESLPESVGAPQFGLLTQALPLLDASVFGVLPGDIQATRDDATSIRSAKGPGVVPRPKVVAVPPPPPATRQTISTTERPVFTLRRNRDKDLGSQSTAERSAITQTVSGAPASTQVMNLNSPTFRREAARSDFSEPGNLADLPDESASARAFDVLDPAATSVLAELSGTAGFTVPGTIPPVQAKVLAAGFLAQAFARLDPLATELFMAESSEAAASLPATAAATLSVQSSASPSLATPITTAPSVDHSEPQSRLRFQSNSRSYADAHTTVASPDADVLASLVNEVLAAQARRHGVDLS